MTLKEKQEIISKIFVATDNVPKNMKDKIEGIIIGVSLREQMEREQLGGVNNG